MAMEGLAPGLPGAGSQGNAPPVTTTRTDSTYVPTNSGTSLPPLPPADLLPERFSHFQPSCP